MRRERTAATVRRVGALTIACLCVHSLQELEALREGEHVYKLHGSVLIRQDVSEARTTVGSRLKLINQEM